MRWESFAYKPNCAWISVLLLCQSAPGLGWEHCDTHTGNAGLTSLRDWMCVPYVCLWRIVGSMQELKCHLLPCFYEWLHMYSKVPQCSSPLFLSHPCLIIYSTILNSLFLFLAYIFVVTVISRHCMSHPQIWGGSCRAHECIHSQSWVDSHIIQ